MIGKLLGIATVGGSLASAGMMNRLLIKAARLMLVVMVTAFMLCVSLGGLFAFLYFCLLQMGLSPRQSGMMVGALTLLVTAVLVAIMLDQFRQLRNSPLQQLGNADRQLPDLRQIVTSFIDGLLHRRSKRS